MILLRHAESVFNKFGTLTRDCQLSSDGREQAQALTGDYDLVVCSKLLRAKQTLEFSRIMYKDLLYTHLCREIRDGNIINLLDNELEEKETKEQLQDRIIRFKELLRQLSVIYPRILVVSHGCFLHRLTGYSWHNAQQREYEF